MRWHLRTLLVLLLAAMAATTVRAEGAALIVIGDTVHAARVWPVTAKRSVTAIAFSPDGRQLAFIEHRMLPLPEGAEGSGDPLRIAGFPATRLQSVVGVIAVSTGRARDLLTLDTADPTRPAEFILPEAPAWSADSRLLVVLKSSAEPEAAERGGQSFVVLDTRSDRTWVAAPGAWAHAAVWHPTLPLLALGVDQMEAGPVLYHWRPSVEQPRVLAPGESPRWTTDGTLVFERSYVQRNIRGLETTDGPVEWDPQTGAFRVGREEPDLHEQGVLDTAFYGLLFEPMEAARFTVRGDYLDYRFPTGIAIEWKDSPDVAPFVAFRPREDERLLGFRLSPDERLLVFAVKRPVRRPSDRRVTAQAADLWLLAPNPGATPSLAWLATFPEDIFDLFQAWDWAPSGAVMAFIAGGEVYFTELEDRSGWGYEIVDGQAIFPAAERLTIRSNLRQIALGALSFAGDNDDALPGADGLQDTLHPYLRVEENLYGRPGNPESFLLEWLMPGGLRVSSVPMPGDTPLGYIAWPPGEVQVVFVDGRVRGYTTGEWDAYVERAKAEGRWPPDW